ncbi:MAG: MotA/TolQ/ExbB proton channel family protein [Deltaproteobacteria bacterium]
MSFSHLPGFDLLVRGGAMMVPLAVAALVALAVIFDRIWIFRRAAGRNNGLRERLRRAAQEGRTAVLKLLESEPGAVARILLAGWQAGTPSLAEAAMVDEGRLTLMELERGLPALDTVITLAPLLGLLGTITGMMGSFRLLSNSGVGHPQAVTGGIAEALIATATGLVVAVVSLVFHNWFQARIHRVEAEIELESSMLLALWSEPAVKVAPHLAGMPSSLAAEVRAP